MIEVIAIILYLSLVFICYKGNRYLHTKIFPTLKWSIFDSIMCTLVSVFLVGIIIHFIFYLLVNFSNKYYNK